MSSIPISEMMLRFKRWFLRQQNNVKEDVLLFAYDNRPRKSVKLSQLMGEENTGKGFDVDLAEGQVRERELQNILSGKVEVKTDFMVSRTGNVAIEYECYGEPSGINATESEWWAIVLDGDKYQGRQIVLVSIERLREIVRGCRVVNGGDNGAAKMYLVPVEKFVQ